MNTFDDTLTNLDYLRHESPSETEEREAAQAGQPLLTDRDIVEEDDDRVANGEDLYPYDFDPMDDIPWGTPDSWIPDNPNDDGFRMSDFV